MRNVDRIKELEHELNEKHRKFKLYEKAVTTRDIVINELKEEVAGHLEFEQILGAYIAAFIEDNGGEIEVDKEHVSELITKRPVLKVEHDGLGIYTLRIEHGEDV